MAGDKLSGRVVTRSHPKKIETIQLELERLGCEHDTVKEEHHAVLAKLATVRLELEKNLTAITTTEEEVFQLQLQLKIHATENNSPRKSQQTVGEILQEHLKKVAKTFVLQEAKNKELGDQVAGLLAQDDSLGKQLQSLEKLISQRTKEKNQLASVANNTHTETGKVAETPVTTDLTALAVLTFFSVFLLGCFVVGKPKR